jgi:hypothetical protein
MDRDFRTRFTEHIRDIKFNETVTKCAHHILECNHECGTTGNSMEIIRIAQGGRYLGTLNRFHVYKASKIKPIISEQSASDSNAV